MKILFYDTKPYDRETFEKILPEFPDITVDFLKTDISHRTVALANGYDAVCVFVASDVNETIVKSLHECGVKLILLRCAGYNNVRVDTAKKLGIKTIWVRQGVVAVYQNVPSPEYAPDLRVDNVLDLIKIL